jgi:hypothetical protein
MRFLGLSIAVLALALSMHSLGQNPDKDVDVLKKKPQSDAAEDTLQKKPMAIDPKKVDEGELKKEEPKKEEKLPEFEPLKPNKPAEKAEDIIARVKKNMTASESRLEKKDVGDKTREIQQDIVRDLDELINQAQNSESSGGSSKSRPQLASSKPGKIGSQGQPQTGKASGNKPAQGNKPGQGDGPKDKGEKGNTPMNGKDPKEGNGKDGKGTDKEGDGKDGKGKDQKEGDAGGKDGNGGGGNTTAKEKNTVADLFKDVWGHLPAAKRMEMDAYSRERFMGKYEDLLREYYRTIAERGVRKD